MSVVKVKGNHREPDTLDIFQTFSLIIVATQKHFFSQKSFQRTAGKFLKNYLKALKKLPIQITFHNQTSERDRKRIKSGGY
jgi:hypothetical protein